MSQMEVQKEMGAAHCEAPCEGQAIGKDSNGIKMHEEVELSPEEKRAERKLLWKLDLTLLPLLSLMYFLASMDRGDIGNAAVAGMTKELEMTSQQYSNCVAFFYIGYIVFQLPATIFIRKIQPQYQLGIAMIGWGMATAVMCKATDWGTIAGLRTVVGSFEAFLQAGVLYLTFWYKLDELATRAAIFFAMSAVAGSMNGLIAYGIENDMKLVNGWLAWRWIFLIEGVISVGCGFIVMLLLPPVPERVRWMFSPAEKEIAIRRSKQAFNTPHTGIKVHQLIAVLKDRKIWCYAFFYSMMNISLTSFSGFLPVILRGLHYSSVRTQLLTIPVYVCIAITLILTGIASDKTKRRGVYLAGSFALAAAGWLMLLISKNRRLSYAGCFLVGMGTFPQVILIQSWMNVNVIGYTKRAGGLAFIMICGQCFAVMGLEIFTDAPKYHRGKGLGFTASALSAMLVPVFMLFINHLNKKKDKNQHSLEAAEKRRLGVEEIGDDHPDFRFWL